MMDVIDSTWIGVAPGRRRPVVAERRDWRRWWPDLDLRATSSAARRACAGRCASGAGRPVRGLDGDLARTGRRRRRRALLPAAGRARARRRSTARVRAHSVHHYRMQTKRALWSVSDIVDPGRIARRQRALTPRGLDRSLGSHAGPVDPVDRHRRGPGCGHGGDRGLRQLPDLGRIGEARRGAGEGRGRPGRARRVHASSPGRCATTTNSPTPGAATSRSTGR